MEKGSHSGNISQMQNLSQAPTLASRAALELVIRWTQMFQRQNYRVVAG